MQQLTAKEFTNKFVQFLKELHLEQNKLDESSRLTRQESIVDLFRLWYMDSREAEMIASAERAEREQGYSDGY